MNLACVGISHHTAPLQLRESLWFSEDEIRTSLPRLKSDGMGECVLFSTCNRTELYVFSEEREPNVDAMKQFLVQYKSAATVDASTHLVGLVNVSAAEHLFKVSSGIDSMVIGDVQILSQVKRGFTLARESGTAGFFMHKLFESAFHVGKRARSETHISEGAISVGYAAVELAQRIFDDLKEKRALVIGAGETAQLTAKHLVSKGIGHLFITNRTAERAEALVKLVGGSVLPFDQFHERIPDVDILLSSVQSEKYILTREDIQKANKHRRSSALFLVDIGVPRNIDPAAKDVENVFLYDLDSLNAMVRENVERREEEIPKIQAIIADELSSFYQWHAGLQANPTISALRELAERIRKEEIEKNYNRFEQKDRELLEIVTKRIVNKILHTPIVNLKNGHDQSLHDRLQKIDVIRKIFGLEESKEK